MIPAGSVEASRRDASTDPATFSERGGLVFRFWGAISVRYPTSIPTLCQALLA